MVVFIVTKEFYYEPGEILAVFSTQELADEYIKTLDPLNETDDAYYDAGPMEVLTELPKK